MHKIDIVVGTEQGYVEFAENHGKALKKAHSIARNGYEISLGGVTSIFPPHRIQRIDIYPMPEQKEEKKDVRTKENQGT